MRLRRIPKLAGVEFARYDFLDFGAGSGGSLEFCAKHLGGGPGLGIDISDRKIAEARRRGREVVQGDIRAIPADVRVRFVSMLDFLEHLPSLEVVEEVLRVAVRCASDFVFVRHPSFEDEAYLDALGLRQCWQNWQGHPSHILLSDFAAMFELLGVKAWTARFKFPTTSSDDESIVPLSAPVDQVRYDAAVCGPKPSIGFTHPVHRQIDLILCLSAHAFDRAPELLVAVAGPLDREPSAA